MGHYLNKLNRLFMLLAAWLISIETFTINTSTNERVFRNIRLRDRMQLTTDVPTVIMTLPVLQMKHHWETSFIKPRKNSADDEEVAPYSTAIITVVDNSAVGSKQHLESFTDEVQIKVRGNSTASAGNGKVPYRLKFAKKGEDGISHKHDLLGHGYAKRNWTLIANTYDRSMLRNAITYHIGSM